MGCLRTHSINWTPFYSMASKINTRGSYTVGICKGLLLRITQAVGLALDVLTLPIRLHFSCLWPSGGNENGPSSSGPSDLARKIKLLSGKEGDTTTSKQDETTDHYTFRREKVCLVFKKGPNSQGVIHLTKSTTEALYFVDAEGKLRGIEPFSLKGEAPSSDANHPFSLSDKSKVEETKKVDSSKKEFVEEGFFPIGEEKKPEFFPIAQNIGRPAGPTSLCFDTSLVPELSKIPVDFGSVSANERLKGKDPENAAISSSPLSLEVAFNEVDESLKVSEKVNTEGPFHEKTREIDELSHELTSEGFDPSKTPSPDANSFGALTPLTLPQNSKHNPEHDKVPANPTPFSAKSPHSVSLFTANGTGSPLRKGILPKDMVGK